jgi:hypothetical protein
MGLKSTYFVAFLEPTVIHVVGPTSSAETCKGSNPAAVCWLAGEGGHLGSMAAKCAACRTVHQCEGKANSRNAQDFVFL